MVRLFLLLPSAREEHNENTNSPKRKGDKYFRGRAFASKSTAEKGISARIWYSRNPDQKLLPGDCQNMIVLSDEFYREIQAHPFPTDLEAAKALSCSPAALDLFMWLSYRCFTARGKERVPLFGDFGLVSQLGTIEYGRPRKFREKLGGWLNLIGAMWPECPARIDEEGSGLFVDRATAARQGRIYFRVRTSGRFPDH